MNTNLINRLIEQSTEYLTDTERFNYKMPHFNKYIFVEKLIHECMDFIEQDQGNGHELAIRLKKHFYDK